MRTLLLSLAIIALTHCLLINLSFKRPLGVLSDDEVYQGWAEIIGMTQTSGPLNITANTPMDVTFDFPTPFPSIPDSLKFFFTIEARDPVATTPSASKLISGVFQNQMATISGDEFWGTNPFNPNTTGGTFFLATPTSAATDDECNGIWFFDGENARPSLKLPTLPTGDGWQYEGWVVDVSDPQNPKPMSTGKFTAADGPDSDGAGPYAGPETPPAYPGQDFVQNVTKDLCKNYMAVISIEPKPDLDPAPFFLKPFTAAIMNVTGGTNPQSFMVMSDILPVIDISVLPPPTAAPVAPTATSQPTAAGTVAPTPAGQSTGNTSASDVMTMCFALLLCALLAFV